MKKMLVVVDYQNDFVDGTLGFPEAELLDEGIANKIRQTVKEGESIIVYTMDTHTEDYLNTREGKALPVPHAIENTPGRELYGKTGNAIRSAEREISIYKLGKPGFGVPLEIMLTLHQIAGKDIETIEFAGLVTNMCVLSNVCIFQAAWPEAQIIVHKSLCASFNSELHQKTLDVLESMQVKVV